MMVMMMMMMVVVVVITTIYTITRDKHIAFVAEVYKHKSDNTVITDNVILEKCKVFM